jgi:hypothetical protein
LIVGDYNSHFSQTTTIPAFQAWFDLGASGGTFGGFYTVTENSNLLAFEGPFARVELSF